MWRKCSNVSTVIKIHVYTHIDLLRITLFFLINFSFIKVFLDRVLLTFILNTIFARNTKNLFSNLALCHHCLRISSNLPCTGAEWAVQVEVRRISGGWKAACGGHVYKSRPDQHPVDSCVIVPWMKNRTFFPFFKMPILLYKL